MSYRPQEFWEQRLSEQFDLRGTGETGLSLAYNKACYRLRADVLTAALERACMTPNNRRVLDVGCGTGFWTDYYVSRGAHYTGLDIAQVSVDRLAERYPEQRFARADVSMMAHFGFHGGVALSLLAYSLSEGTTRFENGKIAEYREVANSSIGLLEIGFAPERVAKILGREAAHIKARPEWQRHKD